MTYLKKRTAEIEAREVKALDMRLAGAPYRQIGKALGVSHVQAQQDVKRMLREYATEPVAKVRDAEVARLDKLVMAHWDKAVEGNVESTRMVLTIMDRRAKLLGLDAPQKLDITGWLREMALSEGLDPEQEGRGAETSKRRAGW